MKGAPWVPAAADELARLSREGLHLPLPGAGATWARWEALAALARRDVVLGRLAEAHTDAAAILAELHGPPPAAGQVWGVWASEPPDPVLRATRATRATRGSDTDSGGDSDGWVLDGTKSWCSGASTSTHALVTARHGEQRPLFAVDLAHDGVRPVPGTWRAVGMAASDSGEVAFERVPAVMVGPPDGYLQRPGFWHGAVGVAAAWYGGACGVADALARRVDRGGADEHVRAHLGAVVATLAAARSSLRTAAADIDADPRADAMATALAVRVVVEAAAATVLERTGRALGAGPLCGDAEHAARVADLTVYLRQSHAERDLVALADHGGARW